MSFSHTTYNMYAIARAALHLGSQTALVFRNSDSRALKKMALPYVFFFLYRSSIDNNIFLYSVSAENKLIVSCK